MSGPRLGIIGIKHMGREHYTNVLNLVASDRAELAALCDIDASALEFPKPESAPAQIDLMLANPATVGRDRRLSLLHQKMVQVSSSLPAVYTHYRRMMDGTELDGVVVVTPNVLHREMVRYALERNISVLCEKPLGTTAANCRRMIEYEKASEVFLQVGLHVRYRNLNTVIKDLLGAGSLGSVSKVWAIEHRGDWDRDGTRVADESGTPTNWRYLQEASGGTIVEHKNGEGATLRDHHAGNATVLELEAFIRSIESGERPHADAIVGLRSVLIGELAERSIAEGKELEVTGWD